MITFRKPEKRSLDLSDEKNSQEGNRKKLLTEQIPRQQPDKRLLSFGNEDEEE